MLKIYNSLQKEKLPFNPIEPGKVKIYVCGMTVYDYCHLGHARVLVCFDAITRYLRSKGLDVTYVRNITDIDDRIIQRANQNGESFDALTERFIKAMHEDCEALGVLPPNQEPCATAHIDEIIDIVQKLEANGLAYHADNGDVYFEVDKFKGYGTRLAGKTLDDLRVGERVEVNTAKRSPLDFVLWKKAKADEPAWDSPWGQGRPGWHIECSAMSTHCLGHDFDIHGGGLDLKFPHHENEIAQSVGAHGGEFVNTWIHVGFVQVDKEKMSKSLGNFFTIRDVMKTVNPETIRFFMLSSHYRSPLNYTEDHLHNAHKSLERLYSSLRDLPTDTWHDSDHDEEAIKRFNEAMDDDFNTPEALAVLFDLARETNRLKTDSPDVAKILANTLKHLGSIIGLLEQEPDTFLHAQVEGDEDEKKEIELLVAARDEARRNKDWATADKLREELTSKGVSLEDATEGTKWRFER